MKAEERSTRLKLPGVVIDALRSDLPSVAGRIVATLTSEVAEYNRSIGTDMASTIQGAVKLALDAFLTMATEETRTNQPATPMGPVLEAAYQLGRGEARSGRTMEALLAAYRVGARVAWEEQSALLVRRRVPAATVARFAQLVFAYIDELSSSSAAGHRDELATSGRVREQLLERLAQALLAGESREHVITRAERAGWPIPETMTAVILRAAHLGNAAQLLGANLLRLTADLAPGLPSDDLAVLLIPDAHRDRRVLHTALAGRGAVIGPTSALLGARVSYQRAVRALELLPVPDDGVLDTEDHLVALVVSADPDALDDLRTRVLLPLAELRPAVTARLVETLCSWLLHQGRREDVAADLGVHPQTVGYRMTQLRDLFGDRLTDPDHVLELVVALCLPAGIAGDDHRPDRAA